MRLSNSLRATAAAATAAFFATAPAGAQQVTAFTTGNVIQALTALGVQGATPNRQTGTDGKTIDYVAFAVGNVRHIGVLEVCNVNGSAGCLGLNLMTIWTDAGSVVDRNKVNDFNAAIPFGKGFVVGDALLFQRYTISDGGVSLENVKSNIANFVNASNGFQQFVGGSGAAGTISAKPGEAAVERVSVSPESAAVIEAMGLDNRNRWNAPLQPSPIEAGAHAQPK